MWKKTLAAATVALGATVMIAAPANAGPGYAVSRLEVKAGPDYGYPTVGFARPGSRIEINGCLPNWSWCDVTTRNDRGWVRASDIQAEYRGRRISYGTAWHVPTFTFTFGNYWDAHYKGRPFYRERVRWERHWHDHDRGRDRDHRGGAHWRDPRHRD
jgi:uncharacterized protein YraI